MSTSIKELLWLALMLWPGASVTAAWSLENQQSLTLGDSQPFTLRSYTAYMAPFNAGALIDGEDYFDFLTLNKATFPSKTTINWRWPNAPSLKGIYNFNSVQFGNYYNTHPATPIPSKAVAKIVTLTEEYAVTLRGSLDDYDVITDFFLTSTAGGDNPHAFEVEIAIHAPQYSIGYANHCSPIGTYVDDSGRTWRVVIDMKVNDILFLPVDQRSLLSATVDIKAMLRWLVAKGTITGKEYFNGLGMGVEVRQNEGSLAIDSFSVTYE